MLDEAPAEDGVYMGDSSPGIPAYACYGIFESALGTAIGTGRIQITEPRGMFSHRIPGYFSNDTSRIYYLKNDCHKFKFEWVTAAQGEINTFGVEPLRPKADGFHNYIARKKINDQKMVFGAGLQPRASILYVDETQEYQNQLGASNDYEILTCKARHCEYLIYVSFNNMVIISYIFFCDKVSAPPTSTLPPPPPPNPLTDCSKFSV
jgi:hypothetical protein